MTPACTEDAQTRLVIISAGSDAELLAKMRELIAFLDRVSDVRLADVAYTCSLEKGNSRIAIVCPTCADLRARLSSAADRLAGGILKRLKDKSGTYYFREHLLGDGGGKLAFVYPGVMSYYPDMMRDVAIAYPECRSAFDELEEAVAGIDRNFSPSNFIFPPAPFYRHDADMFSSGAYAQALVSTYAGSSAMTRILSSCKLSPDGVVGCAGGDLASMMKSGAAGRDLKRPERVKALREIYTIVDKAIDHEGLPKASMISILARKEGEEAQAVASLPADKIHLAMDLSPRQKTYSVSPDIEEQAMQAFASAGVRAVKSDLDRPFNTPLCQKIVSAIKNFTGRWIKHEPVCDVYSCAIAQKLSPKPRHARNDTAERWAKSVRFTETIRKMREDGYRVFLEVGPRGLMSAAISDILPEEGCAAIATNSIHRRGILQLQHALAQLAALGADIDTSGLLQRLGAKKIDFRSAISMDVREAAEMRLSRVFPRLTLLGDEKTLSATDYIPPEPKTRGAKATQRAAALAERQRRARAFDFGAVFPLISDADEISSSPGVSCEIRKNFSIDAIPFMADAAYGSNQLSYADHNLKGLVLMSIPLAAEIMAECAMRVMPNRHLAAIEDFTCRRQVQFSKGSLAMSVIAERVASANPKVAAIKVQMREDSPQTEFTWPVMEATFLLSQEAPAPAPANIEAIYKPRSVHWSGRDIYPSKLGFGHTLRGIEFAETWGDGGLDYTVKTPPLAGAVNRTRFPVWAVNPLLFQIIVSGFALWRSHEKFPGAFSYPCRMRRLEFNAPLPKENSLLNCYLRLTGVTPKSHVCDITVTTGDGNRLMQISGWEEITERIPKNLCELVLQPATTFVTESISKEMLGDPGTDVASAFVTDIPYALFERNEEFWLKILSHVVLSAPERKAFLEMTGSCPRRTEWLYGRIAAKEAVRRYLSRFYQARWSYADVKIWPNELGKPIALGEWNKFLTTKFDIAIAHTSQFVIAIAAAAARVGVDVESINRDLSAEFTRGVFTEDELSLATSSPQSARTMIRFWCAKEAVSKALGTGIRYSPREMVVSGFHSETGKVTMRLEGGWEAAFKIFKGRDIDVSTRILRDHALAFCFIPSTLFNDDDD